MKIVEISFKKSIIIILKTLSKWPPTCENKLQKKRTNWVICVEITFKKNIKSIRKTLLKCPQKICINKQNIYREKSCINLVKFVQITFKKSIKITLKTL